MTRRLEMAKRKAKKKAGANKKESFDQLADRYATKAHSDLLTSGGPGLRSAICQAMLGAIDWSRRPN